MTDTRTKEQQLAQALAAALRWLYADTLDLVIAPKIPPLDRFDARFLNDLADLRNGYLILSEMKVQV